MSYQRPGEAAPEEVTVAVRQDHLLGCAFPPELANDARFDAFFLDMVAADKEKRAGES